MQFRVSTATYNRARISPGEAGDVVTLKTTKQQKSVSNLTKRVGVSPKFVGVNPLGQDLMRITGAREPPGIPCVTAVIEGK